MKMYVTQPVTVEKKVLDKIICDQCEQQIPQGNAYYEVSTSHNDWGNDSHDSYQDKHICSNECLLKEIDEYTKSEHKTKRIEIERSTNWNKY